MPHKHPSYSYLPSFIKINHHCRYGQLGLDDDKIHQRYEPARVNIGVSASVSTASTGTSVGGNGNGKISGSANYEIKNPKKVSSASFGNAVSVSSPSDVR